MDSPDDRSSHDRLQTRWAELCDILNAADADEAIAKVQELQLDALQETADAAASALDSSEAYDLLHRIEGRLSELRRSPALPEHVLDALDSEEPAEAKEEIRFIKQRIRDLESQHELLVDAGINGASEALSMIESMEEQLREMYQEKETQLRVEERTADLADEDTFDQLQRLLAREERLQRELGVTTSEEVIEMVRGLASQLDELYEDREADQPVPPAATGDGSTAATERERKLQRELGVSDPADVVEMVNGLVQQLEELYEARERLAQVNLEDADSVIGMISSMEQQLELLYADRERMSERGIESIDQAISMIESMETQLEALYAERTAPAAPDDPDRLRELETKLDELAAEKEALQEQRRAMSSGDAQETLERELGVSEPEHVVQLVQSMEQQLRDMYAEREAPLDMAVAEEGGGDSGPEVLDRDRLTQLSQMSEAERNAMDVGILHVDDEGRVMYANDAAARTLPGVSGSTGDALADRNFFFSLAPGTNNSLFRGRFKDGVDRNRLDVRFPYTIIHPTQPRVNLAVHLYRTGTNTNWILLRRLSS
jgi:photoactive yellow protein